jgi:hypothetical protein
MAEEMTQEERCKLCREKDRTARRLLGLLCACMAVIATIAYTFEFTKGSSGQQIAQIGVFMVLAIYFMYKATRIPVFKEDEAAEEAPAISSSEPAEEPAPEPESAPAEEVEPAVEA